MLANILFSSWLRVVAFWWLFAFVWWGLSNENVASAFEAIPSLLFPSGLDACDLPSVNCNAEGVTQVSALNALKLVGYIFVYWCIPVMCASLAAFGLGTLMATVLRAIRFRRQDQQIKPDASWRGISISMGALPRPVWIAPDITALKPNLDKSLQEKFEIMEDRHHKLFGEILSYLRNHPDAFVGDGHKGTLLEHSLNVVQETVEASPEPMDPLAPIIAAAHDMGKTIAWKRDANGKWERKRGLEGLHDSQGGLLVSALPSFTDLTDDEQHVVLYLTKYSHKHWKRPLLHGAVGGRMKALHELLAGADHSATATEKEEVLTDLNDKGQLDTIFRKAFFDTISMSRFQTPRLMKGAPAIGWRIDDLVLLLEIGFREALAKTLPRDVCAAYGDGKRPGSGTAELTLKLLAWLDEQGWLVKELDIYKSPDDEEPQKKLACPEGHPALWNLYSGDKPFKGVIALRLPAEELDTLPENTHYQVKFSGLMFLPAKSRTQRRGDATKQAQARSSAKSRSQQKIEQRADKFKERLQKTSAEVQDAFGKQQRKFKALPGSISDEAILDSVEKKLAESADPFKRPSEEASQNVKRDIRAERETESADKPRSYDGLDVVQRKAANKLISKSLNEGRVLTREEAAVAILNGGQGSDHAGKETHRYDLTPERSVVEKHDASGLPKPGKIVEDAYSQLGSDQQGAANELLSKALSSAVLMTKNEAGSIVLEGRYPGEPEKAEEPVSQDIPQEDVAQSSEIENKGGSTAAVDGEPEKSGDSKKGQNKASVIEAKSGVDGNSGLLPQERSAKPQHEAKKATVKSAEKADRSPRDKSEGGTVATSDESGVDMKRVNKVMSEALSSGTLMTKAQAIEFVKQEKNAETQEAERETGEEGTNAKGQEDATSDQRPEEASKPAKRKKRRRKSKAKAKANVEHADENSEAAVGADSEDGAPSHGAPSGATKMTAPESEAKHVNDNPEVASDSFPPTETKRPVPEPKAESRSAPEPEAEKASPGEAAVKQRGGERETSPSPAPGTESETDEAVPVRADSNSDPFGRIPSEPNVPVDSGKGDNGSVPILDRLTPAESMELRRELNKAAQEGLTGQALNRVAIAERIVARRNSDTSDGTSKAIELRQYEIQTQKRNGDSLDGYEA